MAEDELNGTGPERGMIIGLGNEDIRTSLYEGGLKSWECSVDLVRHLATIYDVDKGAQVKKVLEVYQPQGSGSRGHCIANKLHSGLPS